MKHILAIAFMMLPGIASAETFTSNDLVGKWQCTHTQSSNEMNLKSHSKSTINYMPDGTYDSKESLTLKFLDQEQIIQASYTGQWQLNDKIFTDNVETITNYKTTDKSFFGDLVKQMLEADKSFSDYDIEQLSDNKFVYRMTKEKQAEADITDFNTCNRIK